MVVGSRQKLCLIHWLRLWKGVSRIHATKSSRLQRHGFTENSDKLPEICLCQWPAHWAKCYLGNGKCPIAYHPTPWCPVVITNDMNCYQQRLQSSPRDNAPIGNCFFCGLNQMVSFSSTWISTLILEVSSAWHSLEMRAQKCLRFVIHLMSMFKFRLFVYLLKSVVTLINIIWLLLLRIIEHNDASICWFELISV